MLSQAMKSFEGPAAPIHNAGQYRRSFSDVVGRERWGLPLFGRLQSATSPPHAPDSYTLHLLSNPLKKIERAIALHISMDKVDHVRWTVTAWPHFNPLFFERIRSKPFHLYTIFPLKLQPLFLSKEGADLLCWNASQSYRIHRAICYSLVLLIITQV